MPTFQEIINALEQIPERVKTVDDSIEMNMHTIKFIELHTRKEYPAYPFQFHAYSGIKVFENNSLKNGEVKMPDGKVINLFTVSIP